MQNLLLLTYLVNVFVHWVSTAVLYEPRQFSLFWDYFPKSKLCFCINLCRPSGPYSIRPIQKLLNCQTMMPARWVLLHPSRWGATIQTRWRFSCSRFLTEPDYRGPSSWSRFPRGPDYCGQTLRAHFLWEPFIQQWWFSWSQFPRGPDRCELEFRAGNFLLWEGRFLEH